MPRQPWIINTSDVAAAGFLGSRNDNLPAADPRTLRDAWMYLRIFLQEQVDRAGQAFRGIDLTGYQGLEVAVGLADQAPTGGAWALAIDGDSTGLTALSYAITAADLATALNANPAVIAAGGVTVTKTGAIFRILLDDPNVSLTITSDAAELTPPSTVFVDNPTAAAADTRAEYTLQLLQRLYAFSDVWTEQDPEAVIGTFTRVGSALHFGAAHGLLAGQRIRVSSDTTLPPPLLPDTDYYVLATGLTSTDFEVAYWPDGTAIALTGAGAGTHTAQKRDFGVTLTTLSDGSSGIAPAAYEIVIDPEPIEGSFRFVWGQKQTTRIRCTANSPIAAQWNIYPYAGDLNTSEYNGRYLDLRGTSDEVVRCWLNFDASGVAPTAPGGTGRRLPVPIPVTPGPGTDISANLIVSYIIEALKNDTGGPGGTSAFDATLIGSSNVLLVTSTVAGLRGSVSKGTMVAFTLSGTSSGSPGRLFGKGFDVSGPKGTVGFQISDGTTELAGVVLGMDRNVSLTSLAGGETAAAVATALAAEIATDPEFADTIVDPDFSDCVLVIDSLAGTRGTFVLASSGYFSAAISKAGFAFFATIDGEDSAETFQGKLGTAFTVAKPADFHWIITRTDLGTAPTPTIADAGMDWPIGIDGVLRFDTLAVREAFALSTAQTLTTKVEVKLLMTGEHPRVVLHRDFIIERNLITAASLGSPAYSTLLTDKTGLSLEPITALAGGVDGCLDFIPTLDLSVGRVLAFVIAGELHFYQLVAGTDAEAAPEIIRPEDFADPTNAKVWKSVK